MIPMHTDLYAPELYINRELSWLEFNRRCLCEATDKNNPVLERAKFLAICHGNMDEFFMIRVSGLMLNAINEPSVLPPDHIESKALLDQVADTVRELFTKYGECWKELKKDLSENGIRIKSMDEMSEEQKAWSAELFKTRIYPLLTPLALDVSHPFPFISNNALNIAVRIKSGDDTLYARVKVPTSAFPRFIDIPASDGLEYVLIEDLIKNNIRSLFPGMDVLGSYTFRVTRNADIKVKIDEACDLMEAVEMCVGGREAGFPVRVIAESDMPAEMIELFGKNLKLKRRQIHTFSEPMALSDLWQIANLNIPSLKEKAFIPFAPPEMDESSDLFAAIRKRDRILYHPYESFNTLIRFLNESANDPDVQSIKICLYRIGKDPSVINVLKKARELGKSVSVLMELRAKFDETNNIQWARELEAMGVHVVYGPIDLKVHAKLLQVVRLEGSKLVRYTHMSSGNYNASTAKQYGDLSLLTADEEIGEDVGELFNALTGYFVHKKYKHILVAPADLKNGILERIDREIRHQKKGRPGYIAIKTNGLIDADIIAALYGASIAGVKIDLNIRGLCCLRPGIPGVSENIRVISIVDRFLEHSRIYYFGNGNDPEMYLGSSDMMPRNLVARVEVLYPILDKELMRSIKNNILDIHLKDTAKAKELKADGNYTVIEGKPFRSQEWFVKHRGEWHI